MELHILSGVALTMPLTGQISTKVRRWSLSEYEDMPKATRMFWRSLLPNE